MPVAFAVPKEGLLVRGRGLAIAADCRDLDAAYAFIAYCPRSRLGVGRRPGAQPAAAADTVLVTAPSSWETWNAGLAEVVPPEGVG